MRFMHLADMHLGKRLNDFSLLEDQKEILKKIIYTAKEKQPQAIVISGDIYDKPVPSAEAVSLLDWFVSELNKNKFPLLMISGNHDSMERLSFGSGILKERNVYVSPSYDGKLMKVSFEDSFGEIHFWLMPFLKPAQVRSVIGEEESMSYTQAVKAVIDREEIDFTKRNVLIAHYFVTGAQRSDSEDVFLGGMDNVNAEVFDGFDYVALGHLHSPQWVSKTSVRYAGSPLKYSFSEVLQKKGITMVNMKEKGELEIEMLPLVPLHDMREVRGSFSEIMAQDSSQDYLHITLTDETDIMDAVSRLRIPFPNLMKLDYDNHRTRENKSFQEIEDRNHLTPSELVARFYELQNNQEIPQDIRGVLLEEMTNIWENKK